MNASDIDVVNIHKQGFSESADKKTVISQTQLYILKNRTVIRELQFIGTGLQVYDFFSKSRKLISFDLNHYKKVK